MKPTTAIALGIGAAGGSLSLCFLDRPHLIILTLMATIVAGCAFEIIVRVVANTRRRRHRGRDERPLHPIPSCTERTENAQG